MQQYYISGVWSTVIKSKSLITHVLLHQSNAGKMFSGGKKTTLEKIIKLLTSGAATIHTMEWSYKFHEWQKGIEVGFETIDDVDYLRTKRDNVFFDNLGNLLPMKVLAGALKD